MMQKLLSLVLTSSIVLSPITPAFAEDALNMQANQGDTAKAAPDVGNVCKRVKAAAEGNFVNVDGSPVLVTKDSCLGMSRRERNEASCKVKISDLLAGLGGEEKQKKVDQICNSGSGSLGQAGDAYCNLRQIGKTGQSVQYCEAYDAADKAQKGLKWVLALDASAAGICWAEFITTKAQMKVGAAHLGAKGVSGAFQSGICGGAAMAAALGEVLQTGNVLLGGKNSAGKYKVDSNNNVKSRGGFLKTFEVLASAGLSAKAVQVGICYYNPEHQVCTGLKQGIAHRNEKAKSAGQRAGYENRMGKAGTKVQVGLNNQLEGLRTKNTALMEKGKALAQKGVEEGETAAADDKKYMRMDMAFEAAKIFTMLTAMRGIAITSAASTKKKTGDLLQSMFLTEATGPAFGASAMSANNGNMFAATGAAGFSSTSNQPNQSGVTATIPEGSMESFLTPPGSEIGNKAENLAKQIPEHKLDEAANGGASGASGLIAMTASAAGARGDLSPIRDAVTSAFANLPKEDGGYNGGGGGARPMAGGSKDGDLNLKSLFGAGDKGEEETSPGRTDLAFREPAATEDIWHSQNPHGNNLFQIVSDKYDRVQRRFSIGEGI